jgi:hypothetical protein
MGLTSSKSGFESVRSDLLLGYLHMSAVRFAAPSRCLVRGTYYIEHPCEARVVVGRNHLFTVVPSSTRRAQPWEARLHGWDAGSPVQA